MFVLDLLHVFLRFMVLFLFGSDCFWSACDVKLFLTDEVLAQRVFQARKLSTA